MQAVILQQHKGGRCRIAQIAGEVVGLYEFGLFTAGHSNHEFAAFDDIGRGVRVFALRERPGRIQK